MSDADGMTYENANENDWFGQVLGIFENTVRSNPRLSWRKVTKGHGDGGACWHYDWVPLPPLMVFDLGKSGAEVSFFLTHNRWPEAIRTKCKDSLCVNPDHQIEESKSEQAVRSLHLRRQLDDDQVSEIRYLHKEKR